MTFEPGRHARRIVFDALHTLRRTGFHQRIRTLDEVLRECDAQGRADHQAKLFQSLVNVARTSHEYRNADPYDSLTSFQVTQKSAIKSDPDRFLTEVGREGGNSEISTSGSYGAPMRMRVTPAKRQQQQAEVAYFGRWAGFQLGMPFLYLRGARPKSAFRYRIQNGYYAYPGILDDEWADQQLATLRRRKISIIISMPSAVEAIANRAIEQGVARELSSIRGVICFGEALRQETRERIEAAFKAPCLSRYSAEELGVIAAECREAQTLHVNEAGYIVEILSLSDDTPAEVGELGRVIVTDLYSHAMPLIRYDIGDLAIAGKPCSCGVASATLERVEGRTVEMLQAPSGAHINPFFINPIMKDESGVRQFQFAQLDSMNYQLRIVGDLSNGGTTVAEALRKELGASAQIEIVRVGDIPPLKSGKRPYVVNEWQRSSGEPGGL